MIPQFSVIIPVYNAADTLEETLDSVSGQSYRHFEVIIINDGSTDRSLEICKKWKQQNPDLQILILDQANHGLGNARNTGIQKVSHGWIALLDADDYWKKNKLAAIAECIESQPADLYYHPVISFGINRKRERSCPPIHTTGDLLRSGNPLLPSAVVAKTDLFKKFPFSEDARFHGVEDFHLWIRLLHSNALFEKVDNPLTYYRENGGMSTRLEEHLQNVNHALEHFYRKGYYHQKLLALAKRRKYYEAARFYQKRKMHRQAEQFYAAADFKSVKILGLRFLNLLGIKL